MIDGQPTRKSPAARRRRSPNAQPSGTAGYRSTTRSARATPPSGAAAADQAQRPGASIWDYFGVRAHTPYERVLGSREMPGAEWFPGAPLNFAEHMLGRDDDLDSVALIARSQTREPRELTFGELREQVARARAGLKRLGVGPGDRVVAYLPNIPETAVAFLRRRRASAQSGRRVRRSSASAASSTASVSLTERCCSLSAGTSTERSSSTALENVAAIRERLPTLDAVIDVEYAGGAIPGATPWEELLGEPGPLEFEPVPFAASALRPLLLGYDRPAEGDRARPRRDPARAPEESRLWGWDVRPGDRLLWFTTTALDDVERARLGAAPPGVGRDARRQPGGIPISVTPGSWPRRPGRR